MKLNEIIYNIKDSLGSDAEELTNSQYKFIIDYYRSKLIRQRIIQGKPLSPVLSQALHKISIEKISEEDIGCIDLDCETYKTTKIVPTIIPYTFDTTLQYVGATDGYLAFQETAFQALNFEMHAKYVKTQPKWFLLGDRLYVINPPDEDLETITIQGIFDDPIAAESICEDFDASCLRNYDINYPLPGDMVDTITKLIRDNELQGLLREIDEDESIAR